MHAGESDWKRDATKNVSSPIHMRMRQLGHVLALLSSQPQWPLLLTTHVGAPLAALARWMHGALDYLAFHGNLHVWLLQRARKYIFDLLSRTTPHLLAALAAADASNNRSQRSGLRPAAVLQRVASLIEALTSDGAAAALEAEKARLLHLQRANTGALPDVKERHIDETLAEQAEAVQAKPPPRPAPPGRPCFILPWPSPSSPPV